MSRHVPVIFLVVVATGVSACDSPTPTSPTAPPAAAVPLAPMPQPGLQLTYTLSGVVFESTAAGRAPVEGVKLYCDSCGSPDGHTFTATNANGFYSFSWARNGVHPLLVWKDGYELTDSSGMLSDGTAVKNATVNGDTQFDIQVARR